MRQRNSYRGGVTPPLHVAVILVILAFFLAGCGTSFHFSKQKTAPVAISGSHRFRVGERLTYEIKWMGVPVGLAYLNVKDIASINGRECYHIYVRVRSNAFLSKIYNVDDEFHSYIDKEKLYSLRFIKKQAEGGYRSHEIVDYNQATHKAVYKSLRNGSVKEFDIAEDSQDDLSAIYCFRIQDIDFSKNIIMKVNADEKNWILEIKLLHTGCMRLPKTGNINAIEVEPTAMTTEGKKMQKGRLWIWFSADENRIPLVAKAKASIVGTVTAVLTNIE